MHYHKFIYPLLLVLLSFSAQSQTLETYIATATSNNSEVLAKEKAFEAALQRIPQAKSLADPTLSAGVFVSPVETRVGPQRARVSLSQAFPWFGTLRAQGNAAALEAEAAHKALLLARQTVAYQVAAAYYPLYEWQVQLTLEEDNISQLKQFKEIATAKYENGNGTLSDVLRVDIELEESVTKRDILLEQKTALFTRFNRLLHRADSSEVSLPDTLALPPLPSASVDAAHPALEAIRLQEQAAQARESVAQKAGMPRLGVGVDYVITGQRTDVAAGMADNGKDAWMPHVSVSLPLFRKKYEAAAKEARLSGEMYAQQHEALNNTFHSELENTRFELKKQHQLFGLYQRQISETKRILELEQAAYRNSGEEFEELIRLQLTLLAYRQKQISALTALYTQQARLHYYAAKY